WGLQDDLYALVMAGREPLSRYLDFLSRYRWENAYLPVSGIGDRLLHASLVYPGALAEKVAEQARGLLEGVLKRTGVEPSEGESLASSRLRDDLLWKAALFGCEQAVDFGLEKFFSLCRGDSVSQEVMGAALRIGALSGGRRAFDRILERLEVSDSEFERLELLGAVGCFSEQDLVEKALEYVLDKVPVRNKHVPVSRMSENPYALPLLWDWYVSNHKRISEFHPLHHERIITYVVPLGGLGREEAVGSFFGTQARVPSRSEEVVEIALERLEVHRLMRNRGSVSGGYV
ncbi:MAG: ERAP1-like C-terminal domain-containing protein, partial [Desulfobacteraceae bacterium]